MAEAKGSSELYKMPTALGAAGKRLWTTLIDDVPASWQLGARDLDTLEDACAIEDTIAALEKSIKRDGEVLVSDKGGHRVNPAVTEVRQCRVAKMRLLAQVDLEERTVSTPTQRRAQNAANVRWDLERKKRGRRGAA